MSCSSAFRADTFSDLSKTLNLSNEEGEKWIVNLIRDSRMGVEAKIDLKSVGRSRRRVSG